ncbi:MAG: zinc ABC transporter substrate-binding protein [Planctomycetes bacterium]|nr:zinc ABC transporter substrate-binding protein [Planctomycetota bacterium]
MRRFIWIALATLLLTPNSRFLYAEEGKKLKVVTTMPDFADMAREIGGNHVEVESLTKGIEDIHGVPVRPSIVAKLAQADVLIELGLGAEHAWVPALVETSNNQKIQQDHKGIGDIIVSDGVLPREVPQDLSRKEGEQHPQGNPHLNVDPSKGKAMATNIANGLSANAPQYAKDFEANLAKYLEKIAAKEKEWQAAAEKLKGIKCVSYHRDMIYLVEYLGMTTIGEIEPKPGVPPSSSHTAQLIEDMKAQGVKIVIREPQYSEKLPNDIAQKTGAKVAKVAVMVGGHPEAKTWIETVDANIQALLEAAGVK